MTHDSTPGLAASFEELRQKFDSANPSLNGVESDLAFARFFLAVIAEAGRGDPEWQKAAGVTEDQLALFARSGMELDDKSKRIIEDLKRRKRG
jgi:hypothetical protein